MSKQPSTSAARVRYIVLDITKSVAFYRDFLGFAVVMDRAPGFALLSKGNLELYLNTPGAGGAGQTLSTGEKPQPGGWNRIQLLVQDLDAEIKSLRRKTNSPGRSVRKFSGTLPTLRTNPKLGRG